MTYWATCTPICVWISRGVSLAKAVLTTGVCPFKQVIIYTSLDICFWNSCRAFHSYEETHCKVSVAEPTLKVNESATFIVVSRTQIGFVLWHLWAHICITLPIFFDVSCHDLMWRQEHFLANGKNNEWSFWSHVQWLISEFCDVRYFKFSTW
jgi:hypothetical protein